MITPARNQLQRWGQASAGALLALLLLNVGLYRWLGPTRPPLRDPAPTTLSQATVVPVATAPLALPPAVTYVWPQGGEVLAEFTWASAATLDEWVIFSGDWVAADGALVQRNPVGHDFGIGSRRSFSDYVLRVTLSHRQGSGGGLLFNMPQPDSRVGAHLVRYADDGKALFWGYFDPQQGFLGQGFVDLPTPPQTTAHQLEVVSGRDSYAIRLDGLTVAANVPLLSRSGSVGLTASQSVVAFRDLSLWSLAAAATQTGNLSGLRSLSGDWLAEGDSLVQRSREATDYLNATGISAEQYTLSVQIAAQAGAPTDAGGGVIFHMPTRDSRSGAQMVRFADGGQRVFWGRYDESGTFIGQGSAELGVPDGPRTLLLGVRGDNFTIWVDERLIAEALPLQRREGWIGLLSYRGPLRFSAAQLRLGATTP